MPYTATLWEVRAADKRLDASAETMAASLTAMGWTERREGVFGVGPGLEEDEELSTADSRVTSEDPIALAQAVLGSWERVTSPGHDDRD